MVHENVHMGQFEGVRLNKEITELSLQNYVHPNIDYQAYQNAAVEIEAYMTRGMFNNILEEIANYHGW